MPPNLINRNHQKLFSERGIAWVNIGELTSAISDFSKAIEIDPTNVEAYFNRALIWHNQGDLLQALADARKALNLNPDEKRYQELVAALEGKS